MRFYVQDPHVHGLAVLDRRESVLVISSFGDTGNEARAALETVALALNAATDPDYQGPKTDAFKNVYPPLNWRVIQYLSSMYHKRNEVF